MKKIYLLLVLCGLSMAVQAQTVANYVFSQFSGTYTALPSPTTALTGWDDQNVNDISLGFTFNYAGSNYTTIGLQANGFIMFGTAPYATVYTPLPSYAKAIVAMGYDLYYGSSGVISYQTTGSSPNRVFTMQWANAIIYNTSTTGPMNFQIKLYESSNVVEVVYGTFGNTYTGSYGMQVGLSGNTTSDYNTRTTTSNWAATTAGSSNSATLTYTNSIRPANGQTYRWTPPANLNTTPSSLTFTTAPSTTTGSQTIVINGTGYTSSPITVSSSSTDFQVYNGSSWVSSYTIATTSAGAGTYIPTTNVLVRFVGPATVATYTGSVNFTGGGLSSTSVSLTGNVVSPCTGTPTAGSSSVSPLMGGTSTPFTLTATGYTVAGSITFQWQSSSTSTGTYTNITGATNPTYSFTGITANTYYRCNVSCTPSGVTSSGSNCMASFFPPSTCTPSFIYTCSSYPMNASIASLTGSLSTSITDPSNTGVAATACPYNYEDKSGTMQATLLQGVAYSATLNYTTSYYSNFTTQVWIDYDNDGAFTSSESIGGWTMGTIPSAAPTMTFTVSPTAPVGVHRMRIVGYYNAVSSGTLANFPSVNPCPSSSQYYYGNVRDYAVNIMTPPPSVSSSPTSISFGPTAAGTASSTYVLSLSGIYLPNGGTLVITPPTNFEMSLDGVSWFGNSSPLSYGYPGTTFTGFTTVFYTRFIAPATTGSYSGNITVTGGGLSATYNIPVSGNTAASCTGTPTAGTATINSGSTASGNSSTSFVLNTTGTTAASGLTYQWRISTTGTAGTFSDIPGANTIPFTYSGLTGNRFFQCVITCPSFATATTNTVSATFTLPSSSCTPTAYYTSTTYYSETSNYRFVGNTSNPVVINGISGSISDASAAAYGTGGSPMYYNNLSMSATFNTGGTYTAIMGSSNATYMSGSIWIDFNDDGVFSNTTELVGGYDVPSSAPGARPTPNIVIPTSAAPGAHRMRVMSCYHGGNSPGASGYYPRHPLLNPCPNSTPSPYVYYADTRDYTAVIQPPAPSITASPSSIAFGNVTNNTYSVPVGFSTLTGANLLPTTGLLTLSAPANYELSTTGSSWTSSVVLGYISGSLSGNNVYVRFRPTATGSASGNISITGGGVASAVLIPVSGSGIASNCAGTPTAGSAAISPSSGNGTTNFTLSLSGTSSAGGLVYQWQQSVDGGTTWVNLAGGIYPSYSFTGLFGNSQFRCVVTCGTGASATSSTASATLTSAAIAASSCSPTFSTGATGCSTYGMFYKINSLVGESGTLADGTGCTGSPYNDYSASLVCTVNAGTTYATTFGTNVSASYYYATSTSCQVWVDFNNDGVFTSSESVGGWPYGSVFTTYGQATGVSDITIPSNVATGLYRMRLVAVYNSPTYPSLPSCPTTSISYGTARDYSVFVNGSAPACSGVPKAGIVSPSITSSCTTFKSILFNVGETTSPGISFQWQSSTSASSGFADISGATNAVYQTPDITTVGTKYYRNKLTCASAASNTTPVAITLNPNADVSNFTSPTATNSCSGSGAVVTVNSTSLGAGAFTATYNLSGANTSTGNTAALTMTGTSGTFTIPGSLLASLGATTVTITQIATSAGCNGTVSSSNTATFNVGTLPNVSNYTATSASTVCQGTGSLVTISSNSIGVTTALFAVYNVSGANSSTGNGAALSMGAATGTFTIPTATISAAGSNTVTVTGIRDAYGCTSTVSSSNNAGFVVNTAAPVAAMTGGGSYCTGGDGVLVGLSGTATGNTYQLYRDATAVGSAVSGTGSAYNFGLQTITGVYSVVATSTTSPFCAINMSGSSTVSTTSSPTIYAVGGGGSYCSGVVSSAPVITLGGSNAGASYQLYNGATPVGGLVTGTGTPISLGVQTMSGTYTIIVNPGAGPGCQQTMSGSATVTINSLPTAYSVTGGGNYCAGGSGSPVGVSFGSTGVIYTLYNGAAPVTAYGGTNTAFSFGSFTSAGTYSVSAQITSTGCTNAMSGSVTIGTNPVPTAQAITGGGSFCAGSTGVAVGLGNSQTGVSYQLYTGGSASGASVPGTTSAISFGIRTVSGVYTALATLGSCTAAMTGTATVVQNATPTVYTVGGGGNFCSGSTGVGITLGGSAAGVNYTIYNGATAVSTVAGTGSAISFGTFATAGTYTVLATNATTSCTATMSGAAVVAINALPTAYAVGGGGSYCVGGSGYAISLSGSQTGIQYQLYRSGTPVGGPIAGTSGGLSFGVQMDAGLYTVLATNVTTGCISSMSGSATITVNSLPVVYPITGGGNYCAGGTGVTIGLGGSATGTNYTLYNGASLVVTTPAAIVGTGSPVSFGIQTMSGTYTVFAVTTATGCTNNMSGTASIGINPLPTAYAVTGTGNYCAGGTGVAVGLASSTGGVTYNLYNGASLVGAAAGSGGPISFGMYSTAATYTVQAVNTSTTCQANMTGSAIVGINALPTIYNVTAPATNYCAGTGGIPVGLTGSAGGVDYQLYIGSSASGSAMSGTGGAISFGNKTVAGTYTVSATNSTTGCMRNMSGSASITIDALPTVYGVTGGGNYCSGGTGTGISLTGSESGLSYQLYSGAAAIGSVVSGTGAAISFGTYTASGVYTVMATNPSSTCSKAMSGAATVVMNSLPVAYAVTASGTNYCAGTAGISVDLANSAIGVTYQLYRGATAVGVPVPGTGSPINFGYQTVAGTYLAKATNSTTGCSNNMTGTASITVNPAPNVYPVTGGGNYCAGGTGVNIGLGGSNSGINYQLYNGSLAIGGVISGTGAALDFGLHTTSGTYYVRGTNSASTCESMMSGSAAININTLPGVYNVTGGGNYCTGATGQHIGLSGSAAGMAYQMYIGSVPVGSFLSGSGLALDFGILSTPGTYSILGYNPATGCISTMNGTANITMNPLPVVHTVTGGGSYCNGSGTGVSIGLSNSTPATSYQLYNGTATAGSPILGSGDPLDFGTFAGVGTYSVLATNIGSGCTNGMSGTASVSVSPLPSVQTVTGGGTVCQGTSGANVYINNSATGINYQLYNGSAPVGAPVAGSGMALSFGPQAAAGTYTVSAMNATTSCSRNMAGSATINVNLQPNAFIVTGGGNYCAGDAGSPVALTSSNVGISYQLYNGTMAMGSPLPGTGGALSFGSYTAPGSYSVVGMNTATSCTRTMTGSAVIGINSLPVAYSVAGGGNLCAGGTGVAIMLTGSNTNVSYQLYNGTTAVNASVAGTGGPLNFGLVTNAGTYHVIATSNATSCTNYMTGTATVNVNALPTIYAVSGGGSYCAGGAGVDISLLGSNVGVNYQLYKGGALTGSAVAGNGGEISFGNQMSAGTYSVLATNAGTTCANAMSGSVAVMVNSLPAAYTVSGGGNMCAGGAGLMVNLSSSTPGITYQLMNGTAIAGPAMSGTTAAIAFGPVTESGNYVVVATDLSTSCSKTMNGSANVVVNALPVAKTVTGGGSFCNGSGGVPVGLNNSVSGVNYQLMVGGTNTGSPVAGNDGSLTFGMQTVAGVYSVKATNATTGCMADMTGSVTVNVNSLPAAFTVLSMGSNYCAGSEGVHVLLSGSEGGMMYQLMNGTTAAGTPVAGTGASIDFGAQTAPGNYTVMASNATTSCSSMMTGSASIVVNPLPVAYSVTGGGGYCNGTAGANVYLDGSNTGISYQLHSTTTGAIGSPIAGNGGAISFGPQAAGSYMVIATNNATTCSKNMNGTATSVVNAAPSVYSVTGGGSYCAGGTGSNVGLTGSSTGATYQLYNNGTMSGTAVAGTGGVISFGPQTAAGNYTIIGMNTASGCSIAMTGSKTVAINAIPASHAVTGGGNFCAGSAGVMVGLDGSNAGVNYQLLKNGSPVAGALMAGGSGSLDFGMQTASGNYSVLATSTSTGCVNLMTGTSVVVANSVPTAYTMTGGGSYCATASATGVLVGLSGSQTGVNYQLYENGTPSGVPMAGNGLSISFGNKTVAGDYTVMAMNSTSGCSNNMSGTAAVVVNPSVTPAVSLSTGVGNTVCLGVLTTFTATTVNGGSAPGYQWKVNGSNVGLGFSTYSYVPSNGDVVSVDVNSSAVCASSTVATASVNMTVSGHQMPHANVTVTPGTTVCAGTTVTYIATPEFGGTAPTYTWKKGGVTVGSGATYSYVAVDGDVITCEMTSNFPCRLADKVATDVAMTVRQQVAPVVSIAISSTNIVAGQNVTLTVTAANVDGTPAFRWLVNGDVVGGAVSNTFSSKNFADGDEVTCEVTSNGVCIPVMGSRTIVIHMSGVTGVGNVSGAPSDIRLLPNPNKGDFIIRGNTGMTGTQELMAEVTDMLGQVVYRTKVMSRNGEVEERIQISNTLANGMYILSLRTETETKTFHFVMQQ